MRGGEWEPLEPIEFLTQVLKEKHLEKAKIGLELLEVPGLCLDYMRVLLPDVEFIDCQSVSRAREV